MPGVTGPALLLSATSTQAISIFNGSAMLFPVLPWGFHNVDLAAGAGTRRVS